MAWHTMKVSLKRDTTVGKLIEIAETSKDYDGTLSVIRALIENPVTRASDLAHLAGTVNLDRPHSPYGRHVEILIRLLHADVIDVSD
jgi:hypothetical protein